MSSRRRAAASPPDDAEARARAIEQLEANLGHRFRDRALLEAALRHSSFANEAGEGASNERLEFLGDSVVGLVVARVLFDTKPGWREGDLTRALHNLVEGRSLADLARRLEVGPAMALGRTELQSGGHDKDSILSDAMEALVAALYLDAGLDAVFEFVRRVFADALAGDAPRVGRDPKTRLQELVMAERGVFPSYRLVSDSGVEGDEERFTVELMIAGSGQARGVGRTKRAAERAAAEETLARRAEAEAEAEDSAETDSGEPDA